MQVQKFTIRNGAQGTHPLARLLLVIGTALLIGVSVVLGFFAFLALSVIALVTAAVVGARLWWAGRRAPRRDFIEGEFHVVKKPKSS